MKSFLKILSFVFVVNNLQAQDPEQFMIEIEPFEVVNAPSIHSYSWALDSQNRWLIIGGRIDGLHQRQPFAAFLEKDNNKKAFVVDVENNTVYSKDLNMLSASLYEQLQSTNQEFYQRNGILYIFGGYGYSTTETKHTTFPYLTAINIDSLTHAIVNNKDITSYFRQISDSNFAVTGGQIGYLDSTFYLVGGQYFDGSYNPMGPDHGPGFFQKYTEEIRKFKIEDDKTTLSIKDYEAIFDTDNLHRRDYNMSPQIFSNGERGFTVFSGVFQKTEDVPFLNTVDITASNLKVKENFNQYLSQYHSAKLPLYDSISNTMQTIFFGGMSQYSLGENDVLIEDRNVPFVKTISKINRFSDGTMTEVKLPVDMPALLGAGAEFIPFYNAPYWENEILKINDIPQEKTLIGYIYGGIESSAANVFFINDGKQSSANNVIFKVYVNKSTVGVLEDIEIKGFHVFNLKLFPNPSSNKLNFSFHNPIKSKFTLKILDNIGNEYFSETATWTSGDATDTIDISKLTNGAYVLQLSNGTHTVNKNFIKQ